MTSILKIKNLNHNIIKIKMIQLHYISIRFTQGTFNMTTAFNLPSEAFFSSKGRHSEKLCSPGPCKPLICPDHFSHCSLFIYLHPPNFLPRGNKAGLNWSTKNVEPTVLPPHLLKWQVFALFHTWSSVSSAWTDFLLCTTDRERKQVEQITAADNNKRSLAPSTGLDSIRGEI